jgi:hypothetical protein
MGKGVHVGNGVGTAVGVHVGVEASTEVVAAVVIKRKRPAVEVTTKELFRFAVAITGPSSAGSPRAVSVPVVMTSEAEGSSGMSMVTGVWPVMPILWLVSVVVPLLRRRRQ